MFLVKNSLRSYTRVMRSHPYTTNMITSSLLVGLGDAMSQMYLEGNHTPIS